jgi:hypothetical protein
MQSGASSVGLRIRRHDTTRRVAVQHAIAIGARQVGSVRDQLRDAHEGMLDAGNAVQETAAAPPRKSSPPLRRSFAFAPRGMRSAPSCARCLCGSARHVLHAEHALRGTMNRISYPNCTRSALVRLMSMRSFTSSCMQEERAATLAARVELADAKQVRARACLRACACVWLPSPMELANAQRPAKRRPATAAPACGHLRHSVGGSRLGPVA